MAVKYQLNLSQAGRPFPHYWELCVGSCHAATILREDVRSQIRKAHRECGFQYLRFHGLFDDDMSVVVAPMLPFGEPKINFFNIDSIFDFLLDTGMKPFIELGFMPEAFASGTQTCFHYRGNVTMPKDDAAWSGFIRTFAEHLIKRYGAKEVESWYFEVWNEPNLNFFFDGTQEDYFHLYDMTARAIKSVDGKLRVGGPATSNNMWIPEFIGFCREHEVPLDFITTHHYPSDDPLSMQGMNGPGTKGSTMDDAARERFLSLPKEQLEEILKSMFSKENKNPRNILETLTRKAKREAGDYPLIYTEWNGSDEYDTSYQAAFILHTLAHNENLVEGYSYWTVSDIFEEMGLRGLPFSNEFGLQTVYGIAKPSYRVFEALHQAGSRRLDVEGESHRPDVEDGGRPDAEGGGRPDVEGEGRPDAEGEGHRLDAEGESHRPDVKGGDRLDVEGEGHRTAEVLALSGGNVVTVFVYNHDIARREIAAEEIELELAGAAADIEMAMIDGTHCNPLAAWEAQGKPEYPTAQELQEIEKASRLTWQTVPVDESRTLRFTAEPESVTIFRIRRGQD